QLAVMVKNNVPLAGVPKIPYWENLWNGANGLTGTQVVYQQFLKSAPDYVTGLETLDRLCNPCLGKLGPYAFFDKQYASLTTWRSVAGGSYHAMQWTVRQRLGNAVEVGFNYTWSKSIDL